MLIFFHFYELIENYLNFCWVFVGDLHEINDTFNYKIKDVNAKEAFKASMLVLFLSSTSFSSSSSSCHRFWVTSAVKTQMHS